MEYGSNTIFLFLFQLTPYVVSKFSFFWGFPGGIVVKTLSFNAVGAGSIPGLGAKIPHTKWPKKSQNIKQKQYCNKFNKDFINGPH